MPILIDGYNLLHASGVLPSRAGPATFERARAALLSFLARTLNSRELKSTTVVFDAAAAPPGLPDQYTHSGMLIRFARGYRNADELLAELIQAHSAPRSLQVVSSDHQVQRAAKRRKAKAVDSDIWMRDRVNRQQGVATDDDAKPERELTAAEVEHWLQAFGDPDPPAENG